MTRPSQRVPATPRVDLIAGGSRGVVCPPEVPRSDEEVNPSCSERCPQGPTAGDRRPLTLRQAAAYLNLNDRYVRRLVAERRIPYFKVGRLLRFSSTDLDVFLEACRVEVPSAHPLTRSRRGPSLR
jgi:excisionase family DNA binding protein